MLCFFALVFALLCVFLACVAFPCLLFGLRFQNRYPALSGPGLPLQVKITKRARGMLAHPYMEPTFQRLMLGAFSALVAIFWLFRASSLSIPNFIDFASILEWFWEGFWRPKTTPR